MRLKENKVYIKAGITAFLVIAAGILCYFLIDKLDQVSDAWKKVMAILRPFIVGGALAYLLTPACNALDRIFLKWTRGRAEKTCKGFCIAEHIAVDGRSCILFLPAAADALFHTVSHVLLPVETVLQTIRTFPTGIFLFESGFESQHEGCVALYLPHFIDGSGIP